ncbi:MAG: hypothetical protein CVU42_10675 [Chloroflexi bacterium HGW-Chloroflexi-4]|jgi:hypothetical protein|nr:MAG: hypothetical protein CVU42_10675 [Chloroflexi bacterium HGW-Chloroflexi-4]
MRIEPKFKNMIIAPQKKRMALLFLLLAALGFFVFAVGVSDLHLQPGEAITANLSTQSPVTQKETVENLPLGAKHPSFFLTSFLIISIILFLYLIVSLFKKVDFKKIVRLILSIAILIILSIFLNKIPSSTQQNIIETNLDNVQTPYATFEYAPLGEPPQDLYTIITITLVLISAIVIGWSFLKFKKETPRDNPIANEAEKALNEIAQGKNLGNVIINCYQRMSSIIIEQQGLERNSFLTVREFELSLSSTGLPQTPIHTLTTLFEKARYGNKETTKEDEINAIKSLSELKNFFSNANKGG